MIIFGTTLHKINPILLRQRLPLFSWNLPFCISTVTFVPYNDFRNILWLTFIDLLKPVFQAVKGFTISYRIYQNYTSSSFIISFCDSFESLLSGCIPNLHFNFKSIYRYSFDLEIYSYCGDVSHFVLFIYIP